jgi:hypothetical protein
VKKRIAYLPGNKVLPETKAAFTEAAAHLGMTSTKLRLRSAAAVYGDVPTSYGTLSEVIAREMER